MRLQYTVNFESIQEQHGGGECGLFASAIWLMLALDSDPTSVKQNAGVFEKCLEEEHLQLFPNVQQRKAIKAGSKVLLKFP